MDWIFIHENQDACLTTPIYFIPRMACINKHGNSHIIAPFLRHIWWNISFCVSIEFKPVIKIWASFRTIMDAHSQKLFLTFCVLWGILSHAKPDQDVPRVVVPGSMITKPLPVEYQLFPNLLPRGYVQLSLCTTASHQIWVLQCHHPQFCSLSVMECGIF